MVHYIDTVGDDVGRESMAVICTHPAIPTIWEVKLGNTVHQYNHERYHESLDNVTPADVYERRRNDILDQQALVKARTMVQRKIHNLRLAG